jgi:ketosteroid isomerase-like protein
MRPVSSNAIIVERECPRKVGGKCMFARHVRRMRLVGLFALVSVILLLSGCASQREEGSSQQEEKATGGHEEDQKATQAQSKSTSQEQADAVDELIEQYQLALGEFMKGNPEPVKQLFSHQEDVTLANPLGPPVRGWEQVAATIDRAASNVRDGEFVSAETIEKYVTPELAYVVWIERTKAKVGGSEEIAPIALRVTMIFRPEEGTWKVVHRHADPITTDQSIESVIQE